MLYCGEWILNCYKSEVGRIQKETDEVEQLIYSFAKEAGLEKWIEYDEDMGAYFPVADMDEALFGFIDLYNEKRIG